MIVNIGRVNVDTSCTLRQYRHQILGAAILSILSVASSFAAAECPYISIDHPLEWSFSADWNLGKEGGLLFVDPVVGELDRIDSDGTRTDLSEVLKRAVPGVYRLTGIATLPNQRKYLLQDTPRSAEEPSRFVVLSQDYRYDYESPITGRTDDENSTITRIYMWDVMSDGLTVVALADLRHASRDRREDFSGIVMFSLEAKTFKILMRVRLDSPERRLYRMRYPLLAAGNAEALFVSGEGGEDRYWLNMVAYKSSTQRSSVQSRLPLPKLTFPRTFSSLRQVQSAYGQLAANGFISTVILWESRLFLVELEQIGSTITSYQWVLKELDRHTGEVKGARILPAKSRHLMVIPGSDRWAIVEKGIVTSFNAQLIEGIWEIPSGLIAAMSDSKNGAASRELCKSDSKKR
jgi:hypothetical protein